MQWGCEVVAATPGRLIDFLTSKVMPLGRKADMRVRVRIEGWAARLHLDGVSSCDMLSGTSLPLDGKMATLDFL